MPDTLDPDWLTTLETARWLGVTQKTVYRLVNDGKLAAFKLGRVVRIRRTDLDAFLETARVKPGDLDHLVDRPPSPEA
jgi:excisionase family DNA binding protein